MKGGLLLNDKLDTIKTIEDGINLFKNKKYSTFTLLTNTSIACITFKATLKPGVISPFVEVRADIFGKPVNSLLFKYLPIMSKNNLNDIFYTPFNRGNKDFIELAKESDIKKEYLLQLKIYQQTYNTISSAYEPVCPYPIHYDTNQDKNTTIDEILGLLKNTNNIDALKYEIIHTLGYSSPDYSVEELIRRQDISHLGCVVMEFMEGYMPISTMIDYLSKKELNKIKSFIAYELARLQHIGVIHGDMHAGNIMYNPNYQYITDGTKKEDLGRVLLIDFGRSKDNMKSTTTKLSKLYGKKNAVGEKKQYSLKVTLFEFKEPYTFEYIYTRRLEKTLQFRETVLNKTIININQHIKTHPNTISVKDLKSLKNSNEFKLLNAVLNITPLYPTNFISANNVYDIEEFNNPFYNKKKIIYKKLTLSKSKKLNLTKSKKLNLTKSKKIAPNDIYPNVLELSKMTSTNKNKKTNRLEYLSKIALTTIQHLKQIGPRLFSRRNK